MKFSRLSTLSLFLCASLAVAQEEMTKPAQQVQKFAPLVGTWEGSGIVRHEPGGPEETWKAKSSARWVLGGHFLREDVGIRMPSMPTPLEFCHLYGWDRENERYVVIDVSNLGIARINEVHWTPGGKMVTAKQSIMQGMLIVERTVTEFSDDKVSFVLHEAIGDGDFFEHVRGEMKRTNEKPTEVDVVDAAFSPEIVATAQKRLSRFGPCVGRYKMKGWFIPTPGAAKQDFSGSETIRAIFDGSVIEMISKGDPMPGMPDYAGIGWITWDDHAKCYKMTYANNMGEVVAQECRFIGDQLVVTSAALYQGEPTCMRGVIEIGDQGFRKYTAHALTAAMPPRQIFEATYEKQ